MPNHNLRLALLTRAPQIYSSRRLVEAARQRGHEVTELDTMKFGLLVESRDPALLYGGKRIRHYDAVIPRIGASISFYGSSVVRQFEQMGVFALNSAIAISIARDKLRALQILSRHDIDIAASAFVHDRREVLGAIKRVGGAPVILKLLEGTQGVGVILAETEGVAQAIVETLQSTRRNVLIQKFVAESRGRDIRAFVVGDRVAGAMRRRAQGDEFRSNVHRGGLTETVELDESYERAAVRAAQIIGLRIAGVDLLESSHGPVIMEVNSSPGLEGIEKVTGKDIAGEIIQYLEEHVRFGDPDLRQRLSFARGYVVADFVVPSGSILDGKTLDQTDLRERGITVMSVERGAGQHFPAPGASQNLLAGDRLLCYGPKLALQGYLPTLSETEGEDDPRKE